VTVSPESEAPPPAPPPNATQPPVVAQRPGSSRPARAPEEIAPSFVTIDRMDDSSRFGVQMGFDKLDRYTIDDAFFMPADLYGQYVFPEGNVGIYGQLPISRGFVSDALGGSKTVIGNLDAGAYFLPKRNNDLVLRAGLIVPTAPDDLQSVVINAYTGYERMTDLLLAAPNTWFMRLSASTVQQRDALFFRADLGLDVVLKSDNNSNNQDFYGRLNLAGGVRAQAVDLALELANVGVLDGSGSLSSRLFHTAGISLRSRGEHQLHAAFVLPLDSELRGEIWIVSLGYQHAL
jgi:hypothetical protein